MDIPFERNTRLINVLIDQDAVKSGAAAAVEPWQFYDLGHGYVHFRLLLHVRTPNGLREMLVLPTERIGKSANAGGQGEHPAPHAVHPAHRR